MDAVETHGAASPTLRGMRRKGVELSQASLVRTSYLSPDSRLPLVLEPAVEDVNLAQWAQNNRAFLEASILEHGGILFRGFNLPGPSDFEDAARAIYASIYADYGDLPRASVGGSIYESTPYPADKRILFHNESSHLSQWPMKISFYCVQPSPVGGATPIVDCRAMYQALDPAIARTFESKGLTYIRNFVRGLDVDWQEFFHTEDRAAVEQQCQADGMSLEWTENNGLRIMQRTEAIRRHPKTGERVFFNQVQLHHPSFLDPQERQAMVEMFGVDGLPRNVVYGDGTPIPDEVMAEVGRLYDELAVSFTWRKTDMVMLENMLVAHSRDTFEGPRKIVVAMGEMTDGAGTAIA